MRDRLNTLPTWTFALLAWLPAAAVLFVAALLQDATLPWAAGLAAVLALMATVPMVIAFKARWRLQDQAFEGAPADVRRAATKAAWKGPVPADPEVRAAAVRLAQEHLRKSRTARPVAVIGITMVLLATIGSAFTGSPWRLLFLVLYIPLFAVVLRAPDRLRKRIALLSEPE